LKIKLPSHQFNTFSIIYSLDKVYILKFLKKSDYHYTQPFTIVRQLTSVTLYSGYKAAIDIAVYTANGVIGDIISD
jgi:hypothetical protein